MRIAKAAALALVASVALACSGAVVPTIPPIVIPTLAPGAIPTPPPDGSVDPGAGVCRLLSADEVGTVMGSTFTITESTTTSCTYTSSANFATLNVRTESGDLTAARFLLGDSAKTITIGQYQGMSGTFVGSPLVYVQRGNDQLVLQGVLVGADESTIAKVVQLAGAAAARW